MKKILSLLTIITLTTGATTSVVSCKNNNPSTLTVDKLKSKFKNTHLTINSWNNFWGNLNNTLNKKTYYQLLKDQLFNQNHIDKKYEQYFNFYYLKNPNLQATSLKNINNKTFTSKTQFIGKISLNNEYANININIDWTLTSYQQSIYPLINRVKNQNHLAIYDTDITGKYDSKTNPKIAISSYSNLKTLFNNQYKKDASDTTDYFTQYTNFTTDLKDKTIFTNGNNSLFDLKINSLDKKSVYEDKNFIINFYNIKNIFDYINDIYKNQTNMVLSGGWITPNDLKGLLEALADDIDYNKAGNILNFSKDITLKGALPGPNKGIKTVEILYKNTLSAKIRVMAG